MPRKKRDADPVVAESELYDGQDAPAPIVEPPPDTRKAEDWDREDVTLPWQQARCRGCNNPMWTREPAQHDLCEECGYLLRDQMQDLATKQRAQRMDRFVNPFEGGVFSGQTGSLPVTKG
jgi:hypothetical protein